MLVSTALFGALQNVSIDHAHAPMDVSDHWPLRATFDLSALSEEPGGASCGVPQPAAPTVPPPPTAPPSPFLGQYADPNHPGCERKIVAQGSGLIITGADEDKKAWKVKGKVEGTTILVDFSPKGGPADVEAKFVLGKGIVFPDGNVWTKLS